MSTMKVSMRDETPVQDTARQRFVETKPPERLSSKQSYRWTLWLGLALTSWGCADDASPIPDQGVEPPSYIDQPNSGTECSADAECNDDNPCTQDICLGVDGCAYTATVSTCDDSDPCTVGEMCSDGVCGGGENACACSDDDDCANLDDGNLCNGIYRCKTDQAPYACEFDPDSVVSCEGEAGICQALTCDPATGACHETQAPDDTECDDGNTCSAGDTCQSGECVGGPSPSCGGQECGVADDGCPCGTCGDAAICTDEGSCLSTGDACGHVPANGICLGGALVRCQGGALVVDPCAGCCTWNDAAAAPTCADGDACDSCIDECDANTAGCDKLGTHAWTCSNVDDDACLERTYTLCEGGLCATSLGLCIDPFADADDDGSPDALDNCVDVSNVAQIDSDQDGIGDACDDDDDGDGVLDGMDNCPALATENITDSDGDGRGNPCDTDDDDDGIMDLQDNCPTVANFGQQDVDQDGFGDACDDDDDGDGIVDGEDNCPALFANDITDTDGDDMGDACDTDDDGDGVLDDRDNCPLHPNAGQIDADADGRGDACDPPGPCAFQGLEQYPGLALPATVQLGDFEVTASDEEVLVRHLDDPDRTLFSSPASGTWLHLARAHLDAEEHQGSFDVHEEVFTRCREPVIDGVHSQEGSLLITGGFADESPGCARADWSARLCQAGPRRLSLRVLSDDPFFDLIMLRTRSQPTDFIWGAGGQFPHNTLNLNGRVLPIVAQEGGVGRGQTPITASVNLASEGSGGSEDTTYYAAAHYITSARESMFLENTEAAYLDFSGEDAIEMRLYSTEMAAQLVYGNTPLEFIEIFTDWTGRMVPPPQWANEGAIVALARPLDESLGHVNDLLDAGAAIGGVWNQTWSGTARTFIGEQVLWNWVLNDNAHPNWHDWVDTLDQAGVRVLCYINTMFRVLPDDVGPVRRDLYQEGLAADYFVHDEEGEVLMLPVTAFDVALLDLSNEDARAWMKAIIQDEMLDNARCSGWMADFAEALPFEAVMADGTTGATWHNRYPVEWAALNREALTEADRLDDVLVFNRSGHTKTPGAAMAMWQGDQLVTWDRYDGLVSALRGLISGGFSGISINHSDIGGYTSLSAGGIGYTRSEELLKRWTEMAAFTALMRTHEGNQPPRNAQVYSNQSTREHFARMTRVYRALGFYRQVLFQEAANSGWPVVRHLAMHWPTETELFDVSDQFTLGSEILVAPIKNKCFNPLGCQYNKDVILPPGRWVHLWTGTVYGADDSVSEITVRAPIGEPAVFYPVGSEVGATFVAHLRDEGINIPERP